jgi:hypothetical protein
MAITGWREISGFASLRMRALRWRAPRARRDRSGDGSHHRDHRQVAVIPVARKTSTNSINEVAIERSAARVPDIAA